MNKKYILVKVPGKLRDIIRLIDEWSAQLWENGIDIRLDRARFILETDLVKCRFIPGDLYSKSPRQYVGMRADEVFGFSPEEMLYFRKDGKSDNNFKGSFMEYICKQHEFHRVISYDINDMWPGVSAQSKKKVLEGDIYG